MRVGDKKLIGRVIGSVMILATCAALVILLLLQRHEAVRLQAERELGLMEVSEWRRAQAERARLLRLQIPPRELERLREEHAAVVRLKAELDSLSR